MNPIELAKKIEPVVVDYDLSTAHTALEIAKLLVIHRDTAKLDFDQSRISSGQ